MTRFSYGFYPPQSQRPRVTAHNRRGRVRPGCHVVCHQMAPWTRRALQQPGRFCEPPSCASTSWVTGPNLGTGYLKCQGTMRRHSDILEKEAQPPREESKEIVKTKTNRGDRERQGPFKTRKQSNFLTIFKWKDWYDTGYFICMVLCNRMTSFCTQLGVWAHPSPHLQ